MGIIFDVTTKEVDAGVDINAQYGRELAAVTAASWTGGLIQVTTV